MFVGVSLIELFITGSRSLKDKRKIVKSLTDKIQHRFNVSVAEVEHHDVWQRSVLAVSNVSRHQKDVDSLLHKMVGFAQSVTEAEIVSVTYEYFKPEND